MDLGHVLYTNTHNVWTLHAVVTQSQPPTLSTKTSEKETRRFNSLISIHSIHRAYSYSYSYDDLLHVETSLGKELVIDLYNNDVFGRENFLDKLIIGHYRM